MATMKKVTCGVDSVMWLNVSSHEATFGARVYHLTTVHGWGGAPGRHLSVRTTAAHRVMLACIVSRSCTTVGRSLTVEGALTMR